MKNEKVIFPKSTKYFYDSVTDELSTGHRYDRAEREKKNMSKKEEKSGSGESTRLATVQPLLLTVRETARLLRLSEAKLYTMLEDRKPGGIPIKRFGRALRISLYDLRHWLEQQ